MALAINVSGQTPTRPQLKLISKGYNLSADVYKISNTNGEGFSFATFYLIFSCFKNDLDSVVMSEKQISDFLENDADWLSKKNATNWPAPLIFFVEINGEYLVKRMYAYSKKYETFRKTYDKLNESQHWDIFCQPLVVVPRQSKKTKK